MDYLFDEIIRAPTQEEVTRRKKMTALTRLGRRLGTSVRRASGIAINTARAVMQERVVKNNEKATVVHVIPDATVMAQTRARATARLLTGRLRRRDLNDALGEEKNSVKEPSELLLRDILIERSRISGETLAEFDKDWG